MHEIFVKNVTEKSRTPSTKRIILRNIKDNPNSSTREIVREGIQHDFVWEISKEIRPYHWQKMQELNQDYLRRSLFCLQIRKNCSENTTFIKQILIYGRSYAYKRWDI